MLGHQTKQQLQLSNNRVVTRPTDADVLVVVTAKISSGSIERIREFEVLVLKEGGVLSPITITLTESGIWAAKTGSYAEGNFTKTFDGMTIVADKSGIYTGGTYGDDKIQVRKS